MSQTSATAAALIIAFLIFITVRGELPYYFGAFGLGPMPEVAPAEKPGTAVQLSSFSETFGGANPNTGGIGGVGIHVSLPPIGLPGGGSIGIGI